MTNLQKSAVENPILCGLTILVLALSMRLLDIFILRSDERFGEIFFSKALGFILVLFFVWGTGQGLNSIGIHSYKLIPSIGIGFFVSIVALACGYIMEYSISFLRGTHPQFYFGAIDPKVNISGGILFGIWLVVGNIINSFMEEGLFRGSLIRLFGSKLLLNEANWLQALLFGIWHLPWAVKDYQLGKLKNILELGFSAASNFLPQLLTGFVWGYMYIKTNSLWASWVSHTLTNSAVNFLHIKTDKGMDSGIAIRMVTFMLIILLSLSLINRLTVFFELPEVKPWGQL